jgi:hypothetical protein
LNLKNLLKGTRQTTANTTYLKRAVAVEEVSNLAAREIFRETTPAQKAVEVVSAAKKKMKTNQDEDSADKEKKSGVSADEEEKVDGIDAGNVDRNDHLSTSQLAEPIAEDEKEDDEEKQTGKKNRKKNKKGQ